MPGAGAGCGGGWGQWVSGGDMLRQSLLIIPPRLPDEVTGHYTEYPYPAYSSGERNGDKAYYLHHSECEGGECRAVARNTTQPRLYHYTLALDLLNMFLYQVQAGSHSHSYSYTQGRQTFQDRFRVLLPGGGTGSVVVGLGEQLNHTNAEVGL